MYQQLIKQCKQQNEQAQSINKRARSYKQQNIIHLQREWHFIYIDGGQCAMGNMPGKQRQSLFNVTHTQNIKQGPRS